MADNKVDILFDLKVQQNRATRELDRLNSIMKTADRRTKKYKNAVRGVVQEELKLANIRKQQIANNKATENSVKSLTKAQIQAKSASGATTSSVLELGRVISDAPYGIRGMANNLTQLVSQMAFATKAAGGFRAALRGVWTAMMGPLGLVLGITAVISALDLFFGAQEKAEESTSDFKEEIEALAKLVSYDLNVSMRDYINLLREKKKIDEQITNSSELLAEKEEELARVQEIRLIHERNLSKAVHNRDFIQKSLNAVIDKEKELLSEINDEYESLTNTINSFNLEKRLAEAGDIKTIKGIENTISIMEEQRKSVDMSSSTYRILTANIEKYRKMLKEANGDEGKDKKPAFGSVAYYNELISKIKKFRDNNATTVEEYDKHTKKIEELEQKIKDLKGIFEGEEAKIALTFGMSDTEKKLKFAKKTLEVISKQLGIELNKNPLSVAPTLDFKLNEKTQEGIDAYNKMLASMIADKFNAQDFAEFADKTKEVLSGISSFIDSEFERQLVTEQNRTNSLNEELNNRLLNENISKDERARIQQEIWQNDDDLRKRQNEIKKKQFNANKAFQLSMAVADTASSVLKAYASQLIPGDPTSPIRAKIAAGIAGSLGALQIATIARQKFQPDAASTPIRTGSSGVGSGGLGNRTFDFNLVGNNQQNQIADAIQSQFDKPIKAYVVSKDITNQQQLDANIRSTASFGG